MNRKQVHVVYPVLSEPYQAKWREDDEPVPFKPHGPHSAPADFKVGQAEGPQAREQAATVDKASEGIAMKCTDCGGPVYRVENDDGHGKTLIRYICDRCCLAMTEDEAKGE